MSYVGPECLIWSWNISRCPENAIVFVELVAFLRTLSSPICHDQPLHVVWPVSSSLGWPVISVNTSCSHWNSVVALDVFCLYSWPPSNSEIIPLAASVLNCTSDTFVVSLITLSWCHQLHKDFLVSHGSADNRLSLSKRFSVIHSFFQHHLLRFTFSRCSRVASSSFECPCLVWGPK